MLLHYSNAVIEVVVCDWNFEIEIGFIPISMLLVIKSPLLDTIYLVDMERRQHQNPEI